MSGATATSRKVGRTARMFSVVALAVLATVLTPGTLSASPGGAGSSVPPVGTPVSAAVLPTFSERTGFSTLPSSGIANAVPASGTQHLQITFESPNPTFYDAPAAGTAPMTNTQVANAYGLSPTAYASAEAYFASAGLAVSHTWPDRLSLSLTGPVAAVDRAFSASLLSGRYGGTAVTFPATAPSLPSDLESEIASVSGLTTGFDRFTLPDIPEPIPSVGALGPAQNPTDLITPSIARDIYGVSGLYNLTRPTGSPTYATGEGIVLLLWGAGYDPIDIQTFYSQDFPAGFPSPNWVPYPVDGAPAPSPNAVNDPSNGSRELTLDLEWSGSMAPGATLDAVYAPAGPASAGYSPTDASMIDALNTAVDTSSIPGVATISMSFGTADGTDTTLTSGFENDFSVAAHEHITLFAATGDLGGDATAGCTGGLQPDYPSASPQVVAVGGTSVSLNRGVLGGINGFSETAWSQSGGGFSAQFAAPSWQAGSVPLIAANGHRGMPDVAATAGYNFLYFDGGPNAGGGTSFATPLWAGMVTEMDALHGRSFGFLTPALYGLGVNSSTNHPAYNDVTTGANCIGPAGPGWDIATGWGSPVALNLFEHLVASFVNLTISATPTPVAPGGAVTVDVTVTNETSHAPIAGVAVTVSLATTGLGGPCSGTFGSSAPVSNSSGSVIAVIAVPACYLGSSAVASATVAGHGYYGSSSVTVRVNLLGFDPGLAPLSQFPDNVALFVAIMAFAIIVGGLLGGRRPPPRPRAPAPPASHAAPPPPPPPLASPPPISHPPADSSSPPPPAA